VSEFATYYQDELAYLRELGREFSQAHPALAPMLAERGGDPDVERLLEGVAFLTGRIRQKLDDELPQAIQGLAQLLFPDFVRSVPAAAILELTPLPNVLRERVAVPAGTEFASVKVDGTPCIFRSSVDMDLVPWVLADASIASEAHGRHELRIKLKMPLGVPIAAAGADALTLHFAGDRRTSLGLLMWLEQHATHVSLLAAGSDGTPREISLGRSALHSVGFGADEALLPSPKTALPGPRFLEEYYVLPEKFAFSKITQIARVAEINPQATELTVVVRCPIAPPADVRVNRETVKLHCVPVINVFATTAEPIALNQEQGEYLVRPAGIPHAHAEVYSIERVEGLGDGAARGEIGSFYDFSHAGRPVGTPFYASHVRPSTVGDGADTIISVNSARDSGAMPSANALSIDLLATNRALTRGLRAGEICVATTSSPAVATFRNLAAPTPYVAPPFGADQRWRVVAHAAMNLSSITNIEVLRTALDVYNFHARVDAQAARAGELRLAALSRINVSPAEHLYRGIPVRGAAIDIDVDDSGFSGSGDMFLFGAVLERFFASYVSINSFSKVSIQGTPSRQRFTWPARSGSLTLV
jgi:type VI secretion system protein ImpG